jgi:hypothetical protein
MALAALQDEPGVPTIAVPRLVLFHPEIEHPTVAPHHANIIIRIHLEA